MKTLAIVSSFFCVSLLLSILMSSHGAPRFGPRSRESEGYSQVESNSGSPGRSPSDIARSIMTLLISGYKRERKAGPGIDAGFLSRHNVVTNYLDRWEAQQQASDPWGPGRRK